MSPTPPARNWRLSLTRLEGRDNPSGGLDLSFSHDGRQTLEWFGRDEATTVLVQPDGKILVAGTQSTTASPDFAVARFLPNGSLDSTFGSVGRASVSFGGAEFCTGIALQGDGKVVLVGYTNNGVNSTNDFAVARLNANGTADTTFDTDGKLTTSFGGDDRASGVVIQPDGKIVVGGTYDVGSANFAVARLNANGTLDTTFDSDGKAEYTFGGSDVCTSVAVQQDGRIIAGGYTNVGASGGDTNDFAILRLNTNGTLDTTFDSDGKQTVNFGDDDRANAVLIQSDGKLVLAGSWDGGSADFAVARLNATGSPDTAFSGDGRANFTFASSGFGQAEFATSVVQQPDGKLVVGGYTDNNVAGGPNNFGVLRLLADGTLDTGFSDDGKQQVNFGGDDKARAVALQTDGDIVLAGSITPSSSVTHFAVARLVGRDTGIIGRTSGGAWWLNSPNAAGNGFAFSYAGAWSGTGWKDVHAADVTGDGRANLVGRTPDGQWWVGVANAAGALTNTQWATWWEGAGWKDVTLTDVTGDGKADVVGRTSSGAWFVGVSNGSGFVTSQWASWYEPAGWRDVKFADFNGDGKADVVGRTAGGAWFVGRSTGTAFVTTQWGTWWEGAGWKDVGVGDFNADGKADIAGRTSSGVWFVATSTGTAFNTTQWASWYEPAGWTDVRFADVTGDGRADLIARTAGGTWYVGTSTGTAFTITSWASWYEPAGWKDIRTGDFNGDGRVDIAGRTAGGSWYVGVSTGTAFTITLWGSWYEPYNWTDVMTGTFVG